MKLSKFHTAVIALIIANLIWGAAAPIFKWSLESNSIFTLAYLRFLIAAVIILPFSLKHLVIKKTQITQYILLGIVGVFVNILFFFMGLKYAPSINATIIGSAGPIFLIFISMFYLKEKLKKKLITGSCIGLIGVLIVMLKPLLFNHGSEIAALGNFFFFLAMLGSLVHIVLGKKLIKDSHPLTLSFYSFLLAALCFFPFFVAENLANPFLLHLNFKVVAGIIFGSVFSSALAYYLFFWAVKYMPASESGVFVYLDPVIAILIAIPLLHETPDEFFIAGSFLVFLGIYIAEGRLHYHPFHLFKTKNRG